MVQAFHPGTILTLNDTTKIAGASNEIQYGCLLFFVRDNADYQLACGRRFKGVIKSFWCIISCYLREGNMLLIYRTGALGVVMAKLGGVQ